jgi:peptidase, S41 family
MKYYASRLLPFYISVAVVVGVLIGSFYATHFSGNRISFINTSSNKLSDLLHIVEDRYVDTVNMSDLVERSMPQILKELDPHSTYITAKDVEASMQDLRGSFSGIGVQFTIYEDTVRVVRVIPGGPAEDVGLRPGDCIVAVDGKTYVGKNVDTEGTMKRLKGEGGSKVVLSVRRAGKPGLEKFTIVRGDVPVNSVDAAYMLDATTGYIRISSWGDNTYGDFLAAMASLGAKGMKNLVVDLRGNLGGYLQAAVSVANEFLPKDRLIVYTKGRRFNQEQYKSNGRGTYQHLPLVVLVDETSASASEIFAGAMQDNDRATIIGRRSFGKGLVQVPIEFRDGSMVRLTVARYYTPSGRCVQKPFTPGDEEDYEADLLTRAARGEYYNPDSIKTSGQQYKTRLGRIVYGGGGIIPDFFVPRDTTGLTSYYKEVYMSGMLNQFAYWYADHNRNQLKTVKTPEAMAAHLRRVNIVELFADYADRHGVQRRNLMIRTSHSLLERMLTTNIVSDLFDPAAAIKVDNINDPFLQKALNVFREGKAFPTVGEKKTAHTVLDFLPAVVSGEYGLQTKFALGATRPTSRKSRFRSA